jgi:hypothetical protein
MPSFYFHALRASSRTAVRLRRTVVLAAAWTAPWPAVAVAHDVPPRVTVVAWVRPEGDRLQVLLRVPLEAMRDVEFPLRGPGFLDLARLDPPLHEATMLWLAGSLALYEGDRPLEAPRIAAVRVSLPTDRSFGTFASALAHVTGPGLAPDTDLAWQQALLDALLEFSIASESSDFSIRPSLAHLGQRTTTLLRFLPPGGPERVYRYDGDPGRVRLDPRWHQAALPFLRLGFLHILDGIDHLLFVVGLVIPFRRLRPLIAIVTSFTVAHSITLAMAALGLAPQALWFPPLVEVLIALSIVYMAFENIVGPRLERRWLLAFAFGLVHGFGFSFVLRDSLQFAGGQLAMALLSFNIGVELGQILVLILAVPALGWAFRRGLPERMGIILLSALVAHTAWHWMLERGAELREYRFEWPGLVAGVAWALSGAFRRFTGIRPASPPAEGAGG